MTRLALPAPFESDLRTEILADPRETCAMLYTKESRPGRHLVFAGGLVPDDAYLRRNSVSAELTPAFLVAVSNEARRRKAGVVLVHTHPNAVGVPEFSIVDDSGEGPLSTFFRGLFPTLEHYAMVMGPDGAAARILGAGKPAAVEIVGSRVVMSGCAAATAAAEIYDRQVRAFGPAGQGVLARLKIAIVGLGGTGSIVAQEMAHLGVGAFILVDHDRIEATNLNRVVGAGPQTVGRAKVEVAAAMIVAANPDAKVEAVAGDIVEAAVAARLVDADFIFVCTDSHSSRAVIAQLAYQHLIPAIDVGVGIAARDGAVASITGRVQMLAPGMPCLLCTDALDANAIRRELMNEAQVAADPYFDSEGEPQPSVISLNATMSSLAVTMFLSAMVGVPARARHLWYDGMTGAVRPIAATPAPGCMVCSAGGALARGAAASLPVRRTA